MSEPLYLLQRLFHLLDVFQSACIMYIALKASSVISFHQMPLLSAFMCNYAHIQLPAHSRP